MTTQRHTPWARRTGNGVSHNTIAGTGTGSSASLAVLTSVDGILKLHRLLRSGEVSKPHPSLETSHRPQNFEIGTRIAVDKLPTGVAALPPRTDNRGGAHNRADRQSEALTLAQVRNLAQSTAYAAKIGLPFTRMITVHWESAGVPLNRMVKATGRFLDLLSKALARRGSRTAWVWIHEGGALKGGHCHLLVHVPARLVPVVTSFQRRWLRAITGKPYRKRVIHSKPIGGRLGLEIGNPELHRSNLLCALEYMLKGANDEAAAHLNLTRLEPGGTVIGKRCGTSQNIGAKARGKANEV